MTPDQYVSDALRTESRIKNIAFSLPTHNFLVDTIHAMISLGTILDQFKKNAFYGKPFDMDKIQALVRDIAYDVDGIKADLQNGNFPNTEPTFVHQVDPRLFHAIIGIATEAVELLQAMDMSLATTDNPVTVDAVNLLEEFGDLNWYQAIGIDTLNGTFSGVLETNIAKLKKRYGDKFSAEAAINRDVSAEREILEGKDSQK